MTLSLPACALLTVSHPYTERDIGETLFDYCMRMASPHLKQGFLTLDNHVMKLTEKGIFISDGIMSDLLWVDD